MFWYTGCPEKGLLLKSINIWQPDKMSLKLKKPQISL